MAVKCSSCGFEPLPEDDVQAYDAHLREGGGCVTMVWYMCVYCRLDVDAPIPVRVVCLSSTAYLKENVNGQQ